MAICAMMLPPKAGRIWSISVLGSMSSVVQSAVRPVWNRVASRGARERPRAVAPMSTELGLRLAMQSAAALV